MKLLLLLFAVLGTISIVQAQEKPNVVMDTTSNRSKAYSQPGPQPRGLSPAVANKIFNQQFSLLLTGKTNNGVGNYADLDIADGNLSFQGSLIDQKGSVFSITASGSVSGGLFSLFDHSKFNTDISLDLQYSFLDFRIRRLEYTNQSFRQYETAKAAAHRQYFVDSLTIERKQQLTLWSAEVIALSELNRKLTLSLKDPKIATKKMTVDSILFTIEKNKLQIKSIQDDISNQPGAATLLVDAKNARNIKLEAAETLLVTDGFEMGWITLGYKVNNSSFTLFDPSVFYDQQIDKKNYISHEGRIQYSRYKWSRSANQTYYFNVGAAITYTNNLMDLDKVELTDQTQHDSIPQRRTSGKKYNVYTGTYEEDLIGLRLYGDYYKFFLRNNFMAVHLYPEHVVRTHSKPVTNAGVGLFFSFKDSSDEKAIVNTELFYNFLDVFKTTDLDYRVFERNNVGIRVVFPLTFKTFK